MAWTARLATAVLALAGCSSGGAGEKCQSSGPLGPLTCRGTLVCNEAGGNICEPPMSRQENQSCSTSSLCATGLWCNGTAQTCVPWLKAGDPCSDPASCGPELVCRHDTETSSTSCGQASSPDGGIPLATVLGTLTLPETTAGKKGIIALYARLPPEGTVVVSSALSTTGGATLDYAIAGVPAGTYFILGFIDVDGSGGTASTPGDYAGWYGHNGDGNPPPAASAVVPDTGAVRFDFSLVLR
jgi:hypothetical protein